MPRTRKTSPKPPLRYPPAVYTRNKPDLALNRCQAPLTPQTLYPFEVLARRIISEFDYADALVSPSTDPLWYGTDLMAQRRHAASGILLRLLHPADQAAVYTYWELLPMLAGLRAHVLRTDILRKTNPKDVGL